MHDTTKNEPKPKQPVPPPRPKLEAVKVGRQIGNAEQKTMKVRHG